MKRALALLLVTGIVRADLTNSETLIVNYVSVHGDEQKFREDWWMDDRWSGGVERLMVEQDLDEHTVLRVEGRGLAEANDYRLRLEIVRYSLGFIRAGFSQYRTWYDD